MRFTKFSLDNIHKEYINNVRIIEAKTPDAARPAEAQAANVEIPTPTTLSKLLDLEQILFKL